MLTRLLNVTNNVTSFVHRRSQQRTTAATATATIVKGGGWTSTSSPVSHNSSNNNDDGDDVDPIVEQIRNVERMLREAESSRGRDADEARSLRENLIMLKKATYKSVKNAFNVAASDDDDDGGDDDYQGNPFEVGNPFVDHDGKNPFVDDDTKNPFVDDDTKNPFVDDSPPQSRIKPTVKKAARKERNTNPFLDDEDGGDDGDRNNPFLNGDDSGGDVTTTRDLLMDQMTYINEQLREKVQLGRHDEAEMLRKNLELLQAAYDEN